MKYDTKYMVFLVGHPFCAPLYLSFSLFAIGGRERRRRPLSTYRRVNCSSGDETGVGRGRKGDLGRTAERIRQDSSSSFPRDEGEKCIRVFLAAASAFLFRINHFRVDRLLFLTRISFSPLRGNAKVSEMKYKFALYTIVEWMRNH